MTPTPWTATKIVIVGVAAAVGIPLLAVGAFILYIVGWFHAGLLFSGDGEYRTGVGEAAFQVAFPPIDLSRPGRYKYRFTRLGPSLGYVVGFRILDRGRRPLKTDEYRRPDLDETKRPSALVTIVLTNERNQEVFRQTRRLSEWNWLRNMAEVNSKFIEIPIGGGSVRIDRVGVGPDDGWGTHFTPRWLGVYTLDVTIIESDPRATGLLAEPVIEGYVAGP